MTPTAATAAIGATGVWSIFVTLGLPVLGLAAISASGTISAGPVRRSSGSIGLAVLLAMVIVFGLVMRSEKLAEGSVGSATGIASRSCGSSRTAPSSTSCPSS